MAEKPTITVSHTSVWDPTVGVDPDDDAAELPVMRRSNFVAPAPQTHTVQRHEQPFDLSMIPTAHTSHAEDRSTELERSKGFVWRVAPLALAFGAGVAGVVLLAGGNATGAIVSLFLCFAIVWGGAFVYHISRSPAGVAYSQSKSMWRIVERETEYRRRVDWHERNRNR